MSQTILKRHKIVSHWLNSQACIYSVLDAGAREGVLSSLLSPNISYTATDKNTPGITDFIDLNCNLPFENNSFDSVVCLDVLEHLSDPWSTLDEFFRISRDSVIISFPNQAYISFRFRFLFSGVISGKYSFSQDMLSDRHQWLTTHSQYREFVSLAKPPFTLCESIPIIPERGKTKLILTPVERLLANLFPNLFEYGCVYVFKKII